MCVVVAVGACWCARRSLSCSRTCVHACVRACMRERVYTKVGVRSNGEKGVKGGTITVPRFRATTRRHPFDLHPRCRVPNQPTIYPTDYSPSPSSFNARLHPRPSLYPHYVLFSTFFPPSCPPPVEAITRALAAKEEATPSESIVLLRRGREVGR